MSGFAATWLDLREPYDAAARDRGLAARLAEWCAVSADLHVVDLGSGTGSLWRWLAPRLPTSATWTLVEHDPALIAAGRQYLPLDSGPRYLAADLNGSLEALIGSARLVTASALLDLVSEAWVDRLADAVVARRCALYASLTYDGRLAFAPADPFDTTLCRLVNRHQRTDKGFGPALGSRATAALVRALARRGRVAITAASPWRLDRADRPIQAELAQGWREAAAVTAPEGSAAIDGWVARRLAAIEGGSAACRVGHRDLLCLP